MVEMSEQEREKRIIETMQVTGVDRVTAEFILAQELGEIDSDVLTDDDPEGIDDN